MNSTPAYFRPSSTSEASEFLVKNPSAQILAGGTDLIVKWKNGVLPQLSHLVDISRLGFDSISIENDRITLGSMCTMTQIAENAHIGENFPTLRSAALQVGALQIRNLATLGGNTANASPAGDTIPALVSLEAEVIISGPDGKRSQTLETFFTGPGKTILNAGEFIEAFSLVNLPSIGSFRKLGERRAHAISKVSLALTVWPAVNNGKRKVRIALGSVAPTVIRCRRAETLLESQPGVPSDEIIDRAGNLVCEEARPIDDIRSTREYRKKMSGVLLQRCFKDVQERF